MEEDTVAGLVDMLDVLGETRELDPRLEERTGLVGSLELDAGFLVSEQVE